MILSKKVINAQALERSEDLFKCPICSARMEVVEQSKMVCTENHSFDLSKAGYVNLSSNIHVTKYDKSLFSARKEVIDGGFFEPLLDYIYEAVLPQVGATILDAGCGEGSQLAAILQRLPADVTGVGIDLAKEGIATAAKEHPGNVWCVADLANCPFGDSTFEVILNVLSPANYAEFIRLLKPEGLFLKVIPGENYLKELRAIFYDDPKEQKDSDHGMRFEQHFESVRMDRIAYEFPLDRELLAPLIRMTPLSWGASPEKLEQALSVDIPMITVDFTVMSGVKKK